MDEFPPMFGDKFEQLSYSSSTKVRPVDISSFDIVNI